MTWGVLWRQRCRLSGNVRHLMYQGALPALFVTRKDAKAWIDENYSYIKTRPDLRREPHGWRMPIPVRVLVTEALRKKRKP